MVLSQNSGNDGDQILQTGSGKHFRTAAWHLAGSASASCILLHQPRTNISATFHTHLFWVFLPLFRTKKNAARIRRDIKYSQLWTKQDVPWSVGTNADQGHVLCASLGATNPCSSAGKASLSCHCSDELGVGLPSVLKVLGGSSVTEIRSTQRPVCLLMFCEN